MVTVLQRDLGVKYNMAFNEGDYDARDPRNLFLHGLLSGHGGTCVTMPLLYIAIGSRLGYPLYLVRAREHLFVRWESEIERFNIEATSQGFEPRDDSYYLHRPRPLTEENLASGAYLHNLTRRQEAALFITERGRCLTDHLRILQAMQTFSIADQFAPNDRCTNGDWAISEVLVHAFDQGKAITFSH